MIATKWVGSPPKALPQKPSKPPYKPLAGNEQEELIRLRIFRDNAIKAGIEAGEKLTKQYLRIDELSAHLATMHEVLFNAIANTVHLIPAIEKPKFTKPNPQRIKRAS